MSLRTSIDRDNLTKDLNKGITNISYNVLSLPQVVTFSNGSTITYLYTADGRKLRTVHVTNGTATTTDYCGNVIYENGTQKLLLTEEGYVDLVNSNTYYYYLKDHQGNNRVVISSSGTVMETNHYYPFGGVFSTSTNVQPYKYNGKELDTKAGLSWYDYGARHYDAALGRWHGVDRQAEKYYSVSPYAFTGNHTFNTLELGGELFIFVNGFNPTEYVQSFGFRMYRGMSYPVTIFGYSPDRNFKTTDFYGWEEVDQLYKNQYKDQKLLYVNGSFPLSSSASERYNRGIESGKELLRKLRSGEYSLEEEETIKIVGYSMGGAYAAGMAHTIMQDSEYANLLQFVDYLAPYQPTDFEHPKGVLGRQFVSSKDWIATNQSIKNIKFSFVQDFGDISDFWGHSLSDDMRQFLKQCFENGVPIQIGY